MGREEYPLNYESLAENVLKEFGSFRNPMFNILEEKEKLEKCFDAAYNPIIVIDEARHICVFNKSAERLTGVQAANVLGYDIREIVGNNQLADVLKNGPSSSVVEIGRNGFISNRNPIIKDGKIIGAIAILQDLSELNNVIKELEYSQHLQWELDAIFESSFDGLYITDGEGNTLRLNKGFERITGLSASQCIGRNMANLVKEGIYSRSGTLIALAERKRITTTLDTNTGKTVLVTSNPIFDEDDTIVMVVTDVCDITELNELQRKTEEKEEKKCLSNIDLSPVKISNTKQFIIHSREMRELINMTNRIALSDSTVLIQGESGVGKELIVEIIHVNSSRKNAPLIKVNCGAIPENLLESELFGYEAGSFTGANKSGKAGMFELAEKGILFLDEIADMPLNLQVKLLRALQEREICRVGGTKYLKVDIRVLAGTNRNLREMVDKGQFREDLYYRLNVVPIYVPALRERPDDIPALCYYFLDMYNQKYNMNKSLAPDIMRFFMDYNWPGNVRELQNFIERLIVTSTHDSISLHDLIHYSKHSDNLHPVDDEIIPLRSAVEDTERRLIQKAFLRYKSTYEVAQVLGVNQSTVVRKAAKYGIVRT